MILENQRCECQEEGLTPTPEYIDMYDPVKELPFTVHEPGQCQCTNDLAVYIKDDGNRAVLCSNCHIYGYIRIIPEN